jgi:hypothetical protein
MHIDVTTLKQFEIRFNDCDQTETFYGTHKHDACRNAGAAHPGSTIVSVEELSLFEVKVLVRGSKDRYKAEIFARDSNDAVVRAKAGPFMSNHYNIYMITKIR